MIIIFLQKQDIILFEILRLEWGFGVLGFSADSRALVVWIVGFSTNSDGSKNVHDQVGPEHLDDIQRSETEGHTSQNGDEAEYDIDGQLELDELAHVFEDRSSPFDRLVDGNKIVVKNDKVGVVLGNIAS